MNKSELLNNYNKEIYEQTHAYEMWISKYEKDGDDAKNADAIFDEFFDANSDINICYADEDYLDEAGGRVNPWFKPDYSYDTFMCFNYFGNALRIREEFEKENNLSGKGSKELYEWLKDYLKPDTKVGHISRILYHNKEKADETYAYDEPIIPEDTFISIIIPSKDNPRMLEQCLDSIEKNCENVRYEIIVVDNGSSDENRQIINALKDHFGFIYSFEKCEFNFSKMCNKGAAFSKGNLILFLNDDVVIKGDDSLKILAYQALKKHTGAVGVKLYYPGGSIIQHAGITNMGIGPAHKLGGMSDEGGKLNLYHGRNKAVYNMIAVTAAALMVEKSKFDEISGFDEELAVAYNDVDLCFRLYEKGYLNVNRSDISFIHHESVSRGSDESDEKKERLLRERKLLYSKHKELYQRDPFYNKNLVQFRLDADFNIEYTYDHENEEMASTVEEKLSYADNSYGIIRKLLRKGKRATFCIDQKKILDNGMIYIEGWASLTTEDNYLFDRYLIINDKSGKYYRASTFPKYRDDTKVAVPEQSHHELNGFTVRIPANTMNVDDIIFGMEFVNKINNKSVVVLADCKW